MVKTNLRILVPLSK